MYSHQIQSTEIDEECHDETSDSMNDCMKEKQQKKGIKGILIGMLILALISTVLILTLVLVLNEETNPEDALTKNDALYVFQGLENKSIGADQYESFQEAFDVFDENDDAYLNETEFSSYLELKVEYFSMFQKMDADNDDILSFAEVVCYVNAMWEIHGVRENMIETMAPIIETIYNFSFNYNQSNTEYNWMFMEYISMVLYFIPFDINSNGYIHHNEYLSVISKNEFAQIDSDKDGQIDKDEFFNLLYGADESSWKGQLIESYGDDYQQTMQSLNSINITVDMVQNIKIYSCLPVFDHVHSVDTVHPVRRRLTYCYFWWGIVCENAGCQWIVVHLCI